MLDRIDQLLIAMMEHEEKDAKHIQHLLKVHEFARLIGLPAPFQDRGRQEAVSGYVRLGIEVSQYA